MRFTSPAGQALFDRLTIANEEFEDKFCQELPDVSAYREIDKWEVIDQQRQHFEDMLDEDLHER